MPMLRPLYRTRRGALYVGFAEHILASSNLQRFKGKVSLIFTSPPFPLNTKKRYGNEVGEAYVSWLSSFASLFRELLAPDGSVVIEVGNSWTPGLPVMSTLALESLIALRKTGDFFLCQEFVWHNPAKLPTPAEWVTVRRLRVKDSFTKIWWMSPSPFPKADNRRVLVPYSKSMRQLLARGTYNAGRRPSDHVISKTSFLTNNDGAIPPNVLISSNTRSSDRYLQHCRDQNAKPHPARMPASLAAFFIKFLTEPNDIVLDPFAGSNTTGAVAESLRRRWLGIEADENFAKLSIGSFPPKSLRTKVKKR